MKTNQQLIEEVIETMIPDTGTTSRVMQRVIREALENFVKLQQENVIETK